MTKYREILRLTALGLSQRDICSSAGVSQKTVSKVQKRARELHIEWPLDESVTDIVLGKKLFPNEAVQTERRMPDFEYVRKELLRNGVTKKLLWIEYLEECRQAGDEPLMYSQFCHYIQQDEEKRRATMHVPRKPGEQVEVDWAGDPAQIIDPDTGEITKAWIFIGVMTYSQYTYAEAFVNQQEAAWIKAHVHMYEYFGGVARVLVPDNASTAVDHKDYDWYSPKLIRVYHEMAEHYNTAIVPARIRKPKDKPNAEGSVRHVSTWITAALRNEQFFSLEELNQAIRRKLKALNSHTFQKKEGSRISLFLGEEKPLLMPLPATRFELAAWKQATVQFNYHISVEKMFYSVPFQYIRERVDVRLTDTTVEVFLKNERIASHRRLTGRPGQYSTVKAHMPADHQRYLEWDGDRFRRWAKEVGPNTYQVINSILTSGRIEQQTYRACMGVMRLADKHSKFKLEIVCKKALQFTASPSYKGIKNLFATMKPEDFASDKDSRDESEKKNPYSLTRGAKYYGGNRNAD